MSTTFLKKGEKRSWRHDNKKEEIRGKKNEGAEWEGGLSVDSADIGGDLMLQYSGRKRCGAE